MKGEALLMIGVCENVRTYVFDKRGHRVGCGQGTTACLSYSLPSLPDGSDRFGKPPNACVKVREGLCEVCV